MKIIGSVVLAYLLSTFLTSRTPSASGLLLWRYDEGLVLQHVWVSSKFTLLSLSLPARRVTTGRRRPARARGLPR